jgi:hypothetical protein
MAFIRKVFTLLGACSLEELSGLRAYVRSATLVAKKGYLAALLEEILPYWPEFGENMPEKEVLFARAFPERHFDDKAWRYALSDISGLIEDFWLDRTAHSDAVERQLRLMTILESRGLDKPYRQAQRHLEALIRANELQGHAGFMLTWQYLDRQHKASIRDSLRKHEEHLQGASDALDRLYYLEKLTYACAMQERMHVLQGDLDTGISDAWIRHLEERDCFGVPLIRLYFLAFNMQQHEENTAHYKALVDILDKEGLNLPLEDIKAAYRMAINYCARNIRQGKEEYAAEALSLYITGIERSVLLDKGLLSPWTFTNIVKLGLRSGQLEWTEAFINTYSDQLPAQHRKNALYFNKAEWYFYAGKYEEAQTILLNVALNDLNYYLGSRVLLAKIYAQSGAEEALLSLIASFTAFIKRNREISAGLKQTYLRFCTLLWKINKSTPRHREALAREIREAPLLTDRTWLLQQLDAHHNTPQHD